MKRLSKGIMVFVVGVLLLAAGLLFSFDANRFRPQIEDALADTLGRPVSLGQLRVSPWTASLDADDIRIDEDPAFSDESFVSAGAIRVGVYLWPLLVHREVHIASLTLDHPVVALRQDSSGRWNFASLAHVRKRPSPPGGQTPPNSTVRIDSLRVNDGEVIVDRPSIGERRYRAVQLLARDFSRSERFPFRISAKPNGAGALELEGQFGPWDRNDASRTPFDARLQLRDLDLVAGGFMRADSGVGGSIDADSRIVSADGILRATGTFEVRQLQLVAAGSPSPQPIVVDYQTDFDLQAREGRIGKTTLRAGAAQIDVDGRFEGGDGTLQLDLQVRGRQLAVDELQSILPAFGVVVPEKSRLRGGQLDFDLVATGPLDALSIQGPVSLHDVVLAGFSLNSKLGAALSLAGIRTPPDTVIESAEATLAIGRPGITADPLSAEIVDLGSLRGYATMAPDRSLDGRLRLVIDEAVTSGDDAIGLASLLDRAFGRSANRGIGVRLSGSAGKPRFKVDPNAIVDLLGAGISEPDGDDTDSPGDARSPRQRNQALLREILRGVFDKHRKPSGKDEDNPA